MHGCEEVPGLFQVFQKSTHTTTANIVKLFQGNEPLATN